MAEKDLNMGVLAAFYKNLLTEKQYEALSMYYDEDLSLGEIAEQTGITRQGVRDAIKRGEEIITDLEDKLGLEKKFRKLTDDIESISRSVEMISEINLRRYGNKEIAAHCADIQNICERIDE